VLLRDFVVDDAAARSFDSLGRLIFDSDFSLYFRLDGSSRGAVVALRRLSDLKGSAECVRPSLAAVTYRLLADRSSLVDLLLVVIFFELPESDRSILFHLSLLKKDKSPTILTGFSFWSALSDSRDRFVAFEELFSVSVLFFAGVVDV
jgi:hypothetical protein